MAYRRNYSAGGTYFLTLCLADRKSSLLIDYIDELREAYRKTLAKQPFIVEAMVVLPEHLHALWTLPESDCDYPNRVRLFKSNFSKVLPQHIKWPRNESQRKKGEVGIWQRRYWEHTVRDATDFNQYMDYIHYNPVKHGLVNTVAEWPYSTFHRMVRHGYYPADWGNHNDLDKNFRLQNPSSKKSFQT